MESSALIIPRVAGGIVLIFGETEVSWISAWSFHLTAGLELTPHGPGASGTAAMVSPGLLRADVVF